MSKTCSTARVIFDATVKGKRCDYCTSWKPLSSARVMGWCEHDRPMPDHVPPLMILLGRLSDDQVTAYNQVCPSHQPKEGGHG